jgi:hypothetical protein
MDIEHSFRLSWFCGHESHEQDGEKLRGAPLRLPRLGGGFKRDVAASGDPAMAFAPFSCRLCRPNGGHCRRQCSGYGSAATCANTARKLNAFSTRIAPRRDSLLALPRNGERSGKSAAKVDSIKMENALLERYGLRLNHQRSLFCFDA